MTEHSQFLSKKTCYTFCCVEHCPFDESIESCHHGELTSNWRELSGRNFELSELLTVGWQWILFGITECTKMHCFFFSKYREIF